MTKKAAAQSEKSDNGHKAADNHHAKDAAATVESLLPTGSWQRVALGVAAAAGGGLLAVALVGVGPAAVAGAAGYLAYRKLSGQPKPAEASLAGHTP